MIFDMEKSVTRLGQLLVSRKKMFATAESCTGGGIAEACTSVSGSSDWFDCGFVVYSNQAKHRLLGVCPEMIKAEGAVSEAVVSEMAWAATQCSQATVSVAVSGVAGPGGGTAINPVGTVWFAICIDDRIRCQRMTWHGDRKAVRLQTVEHAVREVTLQLENMV